MFGCCRKESKSSQSENQSREKFAHTGKNTARSKSRNAQGKGYTNQSRSANIGENQPRSSSNNNNIVKPESVLLTEQLESRMAANLETLVARLEVAVSKLEAKTGSGSGEASDEAATAPFVLAYDEIISGPLKQFLDVSAKLGGDVKTQSDFVRDAFTAQRQFLDTASKCKKPKDDVLNKLLQPTSEKIVETQNFRENNRRSPFFNHLSAISESVSALGWVLISPTPGPFVKETVDSCQFYSNKVLKDFKEKDKTHVDWVKNWLEVLKQIQAYIKQYHTTGVMWNAQGKEASVAVAGSQQSRSAAPPPPAGGGPPPPPPPGPPPPPEAISGSGETSGSNAKAALFADLNKGEDVTKGLKKVTDDMKTHKNPGLRQGPAPFKPSISPKPGRAQTAPAKKEEVKKTPKCALEGKKWIIEHQVGNKAVVIENPEIKHTVYIYKCIDSVIQVKGKVNSIVMDGCKKSAVVFENLVSAMEFVNCQSVQGQVNGKVPTVSIDKTDGCMMYLSKDSANAEIVTAKSSEMNILIPDSNGEYKEYAVPEQFKTIFNGKKLMTTATDIA